MVDHGSQYSQTEQLMNQNLLKGMQPNNSVLGHLEDISIFQRIGLKRNTGEGTYEENLLEVPVSEENLWPHLEDIVNKEETIRSQRLKSNQGDGGG
ncbi:hypothetical protein ACFX1T_037306 [Malus domestica]